MQMFSLTLDLNQAPCSGRGKAQALGARLAFSLSHCELWASTGGAGCAPTGLTSICPEHSPKLRWTFQFRATTGWLPGMRICWHKSSAGLILLSSYPLLTLWGRYNFWVREDQQKKVRMTWVYEYISSNIAFCKRHRELTHTEIVPRTTSMWCATKTLHCSWETSFLLFPQPVCFHSVLLFGPLYWKSYFINIAEICKSLFGYLEPDKPF